MKTLLRQPTCSPKPVMARFMRAIHVLVARKAGKKDVDDPDEPGHDGGFQVSEHKPGNDRCWHGTEIRLLIIPAVPLNR
jgi:hypothetical protein